MKSTNNKKIKSVHIRLDEKTHCQLKSDADALNIPLNIYISKKLSDSDFLDESLLQKQQIISENRQLFAKINQGLCDILLQLNQLKSITANLVSSLDSCRICSEQSVNELSYTMAESKKDILKALLKIQDTLNKFKI